MKNITDLIKPTEGQAKFRNRKWAEALMQNKRKNIGSMYCKGGRCCLAVAQDVAHELGMPDYRGHDAHHPHSNIGAFFGWGDMIPKLFVKRKSKKIVKMNAIDINDGCDEFHSTKDARKGLNHKQIAECVLNTFVHPKKQKFSFEA